MIFEYALNWVAFGWFILCWVGYTFYAKEQAKKRQSLSALLFEWRVYWMKNMMRHENRIADLVLIGNLTTMVNFLATTTILVLAGILTVIWSTDQIVGLLSGHAYIAPTTREEVQFKLLLLAVIFVFAFFKFTWSMRQHTFCNIMLGALPYVKDETITRQQAELASYAAKVSDRAGHEFNYGLRSYYFALAVMTWFVGPWFFMLTTAIVVWVLHRREFRSTTLKYLVLGREVVEGRLKEFGS